MRREYVIGGVAVLGVVVGVLLASLILWPRASPVVVLPGNCPPGTNNGTVRPDTAFRIYWCQPPADQLEGAYVVFPGKGKVQLDNVILDRQFQDMNQWSGLVPPQPRGNYTIVVVAQNFAVSGDPTTVQDSPQSQPFALGVADQNGIPAAPTRMRIDPGNPTATTAAPTTNRRP